MIAEECIDKTARPEMRAAFQAVDKVEVLQIAVQKTVSTACITYAMFGAHLSLAGVEDDADGPWMGSFCVYGRAAADRSAA